MIVGGYDGLDEISVCANTFATSYTAGFTHTTSGPSVTSTPKSVTNTLTGSGQLSTSTSSNKWWAQDPFTPSIQVVGIGANGERSSTATWQGRQYSPLEC
ncbi:hypothetical protein B7Z28_01985 [Candidatus Saccharibacteria bacterium 32-45-3]|nr:MAG: hypothetical protein B7Z28_01985 [Candidatus Saccharibacteria bacterium 32-45-3]